MMSKVAASSSAAVPARRQSDVARALVVGEIAPFSDDLVRRARVPYFPPSLA